MLQDSVGSCKHFILLCQKRWREALFTAWALPVQAEEVVAVGWQVSLLGACGCGLCGWTDKGAKSICRAHPHLLVEQPFGVGQGGVVPLQEMQLTQLCVHRAGVRCIMWVNLQCNKSCHVNSLGLFLPLSQAHGCWKLCWLPVCLEGGCGKGVLEGKFFLPDAGSRSSTRVTALCCLCLHLLGSVSKGIKPEFPGSLGSSLPGGWTPGFPEVCEEQEQQKLVSQMGWQPRSMFFQIYRGIISHFLALHGL